MEVLAGGSPFDPNNDQLLYKCNAIAQLRTFFRGFSSCSDADTVLHELRAQMQSSIASLIKFMLTSLLRFLGNHQHPHIRAQDH